MVESKSILYNFRMNSYVRLCSSVFKTNCQDRIVIVRCLSTGQPKHGNKELSKVNNTREGGREGREGDKVRSYVAFIEIFQHIILTADNISREG